MKNLLNKKEIPSSADYTIVALQEDGKVTVKTPPTYEYVDLGLPSGLKWAKCNVGAESETDYGKYFQWGDTVGYTDASHSTWSTAPFNNGSSDYNATYFVDHKSEWLNGNVLKPEYDAAYKNMGGNWRMPTEAELKELTANTTVTWETNFNGSGVNGRKFTASNGNYIFIPAAGYADNGSLNDPSSGGRVWSSSRNTSGPGYAWRLTFNSGNILVGSGNIYYGFSVRGVLG